MRLNSIVKVLMERDGMSEEEAIERLIEARHLVLEEGMDPEEVLLDEFGLEPDYVFDLI